MVQMNYLDCTLSELKEKLKNNRFVELDYDSQKEYITAIKELVENESKRIEYIMGYSFDGVKFDLGNEEEIAIYSWLRDTSSNYRGEIHISKLFIIAMYEMFFGMDMDEFTSNREQDPLLRNALFYLSFALIVNHELAHIYKGHLQLYAIWKKDSLIENHKLDIRTMEWDADCYAATRMAENVNVMTKDFGHDNICKAMCLAIHGAMYWMREFSDFDVIESKEHLPYWYREISMLMSLADLVSDRQTIASLMIKNEKVFNDQFKVNSRAGDIYYLKSIVEYRFLAEVEENWDNMKSLLLPYSLLPLDE